MDEADQAGVRGGGGGGGSADPPDPPWLRAWVLSYLVELFVYIYSAHIKLCNPHRMAGPHSWQHQFMDMLIL